MCAHASRCQHAAARKKGPITSETGMLSLQVLMQSAGRGLLSRLCNWMRQLPAAAPSSPAVQEQTLRMQIVHGNTVCQLPPSSNLAQCSRQGQQCSPLDGSGRMMGPEMAPMLHLTWVWAMCLSMNQQLSWWRRGCS